MQPDFTAKDKLISNLHLDIQSSPNQDNIDFFNGKNDSVLRWLNAEYNNPKKEPVTESEWLEFIEFLIEDDKNSERISVREEIIIGTETISQKQKLQEFMDLHEGDSSKVAICLYTYNPNGIYRRLGRAISELNREYLSKYTTFISQLGVYLKSNRLNSSHINRKELYRGSKQRDVSIFTENTILQCRNFVSTSFSLSTSVEYAYYEEKDNEGNTVRVLSTYENII